MSVDALEFSKAPEHRRKAGDVQRPPVPMRRSDDYLRSLNDGRVVFINGEQVADVTRHKAFAAAARSMGHLYDMAADPALTDVLTFAAPDTGHRVLRAYQIPKTHADLRARRMASEKWAEATFGLMGRTL